MIEEKIMVQRTNQLNMNIDIIQKIQNHMGDDLSKKLYKLRLQYSMFEGEEEQADIVKTSEGAKQLINIVNQLSDSHFVLFGSGMGARWLISILDNIKWKCIIDKIILIRIFLRGFLLFIIININIRLEI